MPYQPFNYSTVEHRPWPLLQRFSRRILVIVLRLLIRLEVEGVENIPRMGSFILAANHLHLLDPAIGLLLVPRRMVGIVKDKWQKPPFSWLLSGMSDIIYVGQSNRHGLLEAVKALQTGGVVAILPEGTRSRTGALRKGQPGVALLATHAPAPVLPAASYGQEHATRYWKRLRRVPVRVRIGPLIEFPAGKAEKDQLQAYTDQIMIALARLLPHEYRGVYAELARIAGEDHALS
jgi:1-acyl-sn-glycerol-3-phosphate acyltransferase